MIAHFIQIFLISLFFFFLDVSSVTINFFSCIHFLMMFLVVLLFTGTSPRLFSIPLFFLGLESFIFYNRFGLTFIYSIPALLCMWWIKKRIASTALEITFFALIMLIIHHAVFSVFVLKQEVFTHCTFWQIGANLLVTYFSLKWLPTVERGNRF